MSNTEHVIATMLILGLVVGFCGGALFGLWYAERTQKRERKERLEIGELVKNARAKTFAQAVCDDIDEAKRKKEQYGDFVHAAMQMKNDVDKMRDEK